MIEDLPLDLADGVILIDLIEQDTLEASNRIRNNSVDLTADPAAIQPMFKHYNRKPKHPVHRTENIEQVLNFLRSKGLALHGIAAQSISDGNNVKAVLGLIWQIILRYDLERSRKMPIRRNSALD